MQSVKLLSEFLRQILSP